MDIETLFNELNYAIVNGLLNSREKSLALTKLEEAQMWAEKAVLLED